MPLLGDVDVALAALGPCKTLFPAELTARRAALQDLFIDRTQTGDMTMVHNLLTVLANPFDEHPAHDAWAGMPPDWAASIEISCSS